jgi:hypothetical protein
MHAWYLRNIIGRVTVVILSHYPSGVRIKNKPQAVGAFLVGMFFIACGFIMHIQLIFDSAPLGIHLILIGVQLFILVVAIRGARTQLQVTSDEFIVMNAYWTHRVKASEVCGVTTKFARGTAIQLKNGKKIPVEACSPMNYNSPAKAKRTIRELEEVVERYGSPGCP